MTFTGEPDAAAGLRALVQAGIAVVEFTPATGALEHAFLDLRQQQPAEPPAPPQPPTPPTAPTEGDAS